MIAYQLLGAAALCAACGIGGYLHGVDVTEHSQLKQQAIVDEAAKAARSATAEEIAKIKIVNRTVNQKVIREISENPVYKDCRVPKSGVDSANHALTGEALAE